MSLLTTQGIETEIAALLFPVSALTIVLAMPLVGRMLAHEETEGRCFNGNGPRCTAANGKRVQSYGVTRWRMIASMQTRMHGRRENPPMPVRI